MAEGVKYIKVAKIDKNGVDQTLSLQSLSVLTIPYSTGNVAYEILSISEQLNYFLYSVDNPNIEHGDRALLEYNFTGSANTIETPVSGAKIIDEISITSVSDPLLFSATSSIDPSINIVKLNTYPQKNLLLSITGSLVVNNNGAGGGYAGVYDPIISITEHQSNGTINELVTQDLSNVGPGGVTTTYNFHLTHTIPSGSTPGTEFGFQLLSKQAVASVTGSFQFSDTQVFLTSSVASGPAVETIPEPFFTQNFNRSLDCQPTLNNIIINRRSYQYQDIDYTSGMFIPTNFDLLINDTALKAQVQDSNYTTKRHIRPRYEGSKNTTDDVNSSAITQSTYLQILHPNDDLGVSTFTLPSIESLDSTMHEFSMGGGTSPEIPGCGAVLVANAYNISGKDSVNIISPLDSSYTELLKSKFPQNSKPYITRYTVPNETIQNNNLSWNDIADAKVIDTYISPPPLSSYMIGSGNSFTGGTPLNNSTLRMSKYSYAPFIDSDGFYSTASSPFITYTSDDTSDNVIKNGLDLGENWYITIFNDLPSPVQGNLDVFNSGSDYSYISLDNNGNYSDPLANHGVYKITGVETPVYGNVNYSMSISPPLPDTGSEATRWEFGNAGGKGYLIWKAIPNPSIVFDNVTLSGVGKGNVITETPTSTVKDNLTYISKTYGENT